MAVPTAGESPLPGFLNTIREENCENVVFIHFLYYPSSQVKCADHGCRTLTGAESIVLYLKHPVEWISVQYKPGILLFKLFS